LEVKNAQDERNLLTRIEASWSAMQFDRIYCIKFAAQN